MTKKLSFISVFVFCFLAANVSVQPAVGQSPTRDNDLSNRITERLQRLKTDLDTGQLQALKATCKPAQNKINAARKVAEVYSTTQGQKVDKIIENVTRLSTNLKSQGKDSGQVDTLLGGITELKKQIDTTYQNYLLALEDTAKVECEANPEGFRTSLDDAKGQFSNLADLRKSQKDLIKIELKDALTELKGSL